MNTEKNDYFILAKDLGKKYLKNKYNFTINKNDLVIITGKNGTGKTTLFKLLLGFVKKDFGILDKKYKNISFLPEKLKISNELTVIEYLSIISKIKNSNIPYYELFYFDLDLNKKINKLSKGNLQKLGIIMTLMGDSDLYILDEPLSGLDENNILKFIDYLRNINNKTIILSTHNKIYFENVKKKEIILC